MYKVSKLIITRLWLAAFMLLAVGCARNEYENIPNRIEGDIVSFRTETRDDFATRAAGTTTSGAYGVRSMGVYATYTSDLWDGTTAPNNFFDNLNVNRSDDFSPWTYNNEQLWPGSGKLTFFAYAPHSENSVYGLNKPIVSTSTATPTLEYTIAPTHDKQVDLLVATPVKDQSKRDYVTIPLRHALTKVAFSARVENSLPANVEIRITEISITNLNSKGAISMDGTNRQWTALSNPTTYTQTNLVGGGLRSLPLTDTYQSLTPTEGHLFLMPQTILYNNDTDMAAVTVKYTTTTAGVSDGGKEYTLALGRAITKFDPGVAYNLMVTINNGITFIVVPTKWDDTEVKADIKNRILNVTRIEANIYPGVANRIWFWSNQPTDSVYVRSEGNLDNGAKYPTGAVYTVGSVFQDLSNAKAANLHYKGFDGITTASGEGYIDVVMIDKTTAPFLPELTDGDKRHIWINASGLARNILLNSVVRGNLTTTPYVGTFHRWNETGERIVTWGYNNKWSAKVIVEPSAGEILIDTLSSPYMATGQLYGDPNKVGDPEIAQLNNSSTTEIISKGRVYLRVGWKSRLASRGENPRYGVIEIKEYEADEVSVKNIRYLYIRQGEADDYILSMGRAAAVKFSPFNLTVEGLTTGGSVQVQPNRTNARFVQYPTQAGAIYKWVNPILTVRPSAYAPVGTVNFEQVIYNGFWWSVISTQESCPMGYRRPNRGSNASSVVSGTTNEPEEILHSLFANVNNTSGANEPSNSIWGYYADGFFDRRVIENGVGGFDIGSACAVEPTSANVGYIGRLFYNPEYSFPARSSAVSVCNSIFFPAAGYRSDQKQYKVGTEGHYWSSSAFTNAGATEGWELVVGSGSLANTNTNNLNGNSIRCVRDIGFSTDLPPYNETGVPTALAFNADARNATPNPVNVDAVFVAKWNTTMARDFRLYTELNPEGDKVILKISAKITFRGTTTTGNHDVTTDIFATSLGKIGSSVTYNFNHNELTWTTNTSFTFNVLEGWNAIRYLGSSTIPDAIVTGAEGIYAPITLNQKGRIVFTRTSSLATP